MVFKVLLLPLAEKEINESIDFYESKRKGLGKEFLIHLTSFIKILKVYPHICVIKKLPHYRELPLKKFPFVIIFEISQNEVIVHSVFHTSRNSHKKP